MILGESMTVLKSDPSPCYTLIQITDTHLMSKAELSFATLYPAQSFERVLVHIQRHYPQTDLILHTGDLAQEPIAATYEYYLRCMNQLGLNYCQIPGNHDDAQYFPFYQNQRDVQALHLGKWSIILLNSQVEDKIFGEISATQQSQLQQLLDQYSEQHIIVSLHHHPFPMQSKWIDAHILQNTDQLLEILAPYQNIKLILCGHVHQDSVHYWQNLACYSTPSTSVQFKPHSEDFALDEMEIGYRVLYLKPDGSYETQIQRIKEDLAKINLQISEY